MERQRLWQACYVLLLREGTHSPTQVRALCAVLRKAATQAGKGGLLGGLRLRALVFVYRYSAAYKAFYVCLYYRYYD